MRINLSPFHLALLPSTSVCKGLLFACLLLIAGTASAQKTKAQLEQEKKQNLRKIAEAEKILTATRSERKVTIGQLQALEQQIKARESLIKGLTQEVGLLDSEIHDLNVVVVALQRDLGNLKDEYAQMIYASYKANQGFNLLTFLFSAETFNQLFLRLKYLEQYADARKVQAEQIEAVTFELNDQRSSVEIKRDQQQVLLKQQLRESKKLLTLKSRKNSVIASLNKRESQLIAEVADRKKAVDKLDETIAAFVRDEIESDATASSLSLASSEEISNSFETNKNALKWPVASGFISKKFGTQPHPVLKRIKTKNNGVDIQTNGDEGVRSVFDGEVKMVGYLQGMNNFVMIKHGSYYTVYSRLKNVVVKKGQKLRALDPLGEVYTDSDGVSEVHFEVWKNTEKLDPEKWLSR